MSLPAPPVVVGRVNCVEEGFLTLIADTSVCRLPGSFGEVVTTAERSCYESLPLLWQLCSHWIIFTITSFGSKVTLVSAFLLRLLSRIRATCASYKPKLTV